MLKEQVKKLKEELRVGNNLTAKLTDKCRELELKIGQIKKEERNRIIAEVDKLTVINPHHITCEDWEKTHKEKLTYGHLPGCLIYSAAVRDIKKQLLEPMR